MAVEKQYPFRFVGAYAVLAVVSLTAILIFCAIMFTPITPVAHKSDITKALGSTQDKALIRDAEKEIASGAKTSGVTIQEQHPYKITHPSKDEADVFVKVKTVELNTVKLKVIFHKGIYSVSRVEAVK